MGETRRRLETQIKEHKDACKHHHQSCGKRPQWLKERAHGGNCIWKRHCTSNLYLRVRASIIRQELPNYWIDTLKAMLWLRHVASLLSRLCAEWDTLPLYSQGYALSETCCLSTFKAMLWVRHIASLLSRLCSEWDALPLYSQGWVRHIASLLSRLCFDWDTLPLTLKAKLWVRQVASLLSRLCSEWDTLPLYSQGYVLSETHCLSTLKVMCWVRHIASLLSRLCSEWDTLPLTLKAKLWVRHVASLLSRLCSEWDTLPLYSQGYALSETHCLSTLKAMLWVRHITSYSQG